MKDPLFPAWTCAFGFIIGAFIGSFLNMVIYRLPRGLSFSEPKRSMCPNCKHSLDWIDLMPIFSWLSTGGKCRYCKQPIAVRYLTVELLNGAFFAAIWWKTMTGTADPNVIHFVAYCAAASLLVAIIYIDWELYIIPDELNASLLVVGIGLGYATHNLAGAVQGALLGWGLLWGIALLGRLAFGKDAMGDGDIKMMRGVGAIIGPLLMVANLGIAVVLGLIGGITGILLAKRGSSGESNSDESPSSDEEGVNTPTSVGLVFLTGAWYLLCLDIVALVVPPLNRWIEGKFPQETIDQEDEWKPSLTTIPFGPYLAAGAIVCLLFGGEIETAMRDYWRKATGEPSQTAAVRVHMGKLVEANNGLGTRDA